MNTFVIVPERSGMLKRFIEMNFPDAVEKEEIAVLIGSLGDEYLPVWLVPKTHCWADEETDADVGEVSDSDQAADFSDFQVDSLFGFFEKGDVDFDQYDIDPDNATRAYLGCSLVIRGTDMEEALCPQDSFELIRCLEQAVPPGKIRFSLSVSMMDQRFSKMWTNELKGEVRIDSDLGAQDIIVPEGCEKDMMSTFLQIVLRDNGFYWKRKIFSFVEDVADDLIELIHDSVYSDCN
ncbi:MAG: hypothetical protein HGA31_05500 [Candidatus Moranbacteria bacterium]|nr:hypothetical protein [Candidatus Moranbacteria bacterium]